MSRFASILMLMSAAACASTGVSTGATFRSGVGDAYLERPPYYAGQGRVAGMRVVYLPVHFQRGASHAPMVDPRGDASSPASAMLKEMNAVLDSVAASHNATVLRAGPGAGAPNVQFGCALDATGDCVERGDSVLGRRGTTMQLALHRPSPEWTAAVRRLIDSAGATHAVLLTLEVGQYWPRQSGLRGSKRVELGTNHSVSLPWLTSLETPVSVLQVTGALMDRDGRGVRIGAEGIAAQRTPLLASALGAQRLITDDDVERARSVRRDDVRGAPLAWRVALCTLVRELGGADNCQ